MGDYNPDQPHILGQEWVPIRDEDVALTPVVNALELGHGFTLTASRQASAARFYLNTFPSGDATGQTFMINVYEAGTEALSGPIRSVIIPCDNGGVTGNTSFTNASSVAAAVADPSDLANVTMSSGSPANSRVTAFFNVDDYAPLLVGKRIAGVNLLYVITGDWAELEAVDGQLTIAITNDANQRALYGDNTKGTIVQVESSAIAPEISRLRFGEINQFWSPTLSPWGTPDRMPWTYAGLARFEAGSADRIKVQLDMNEATSFIGIEVDYLALEVIYCEEQRVALGGRAFGLGAAPLTPNAFRPYVIGANTVPLRTVAGAANPILPAGDYTVTLSSADVGDFIFTNLVSSIPYPLLNGARQLYGIAPHPAVQVDIPFPVEEHIGDTFTLFSPDAGQVSRILPQLSVHASGAVLTEPHVYGRQIAAQVYGTVTATQDIDDTTVAAADYEQVRFYARRYGDTAVDLKLTDGTAQVSVTPAEWDALPEIVDGWKEVTLSFPTPPTLGGSTLPTWTFSAAGENAGNRWEILGACAPAVSGIAGNLLNQAVQQLDSATYQPPLGASVNAAWMPLGCGSVWASGTTADPHSDLTLIFSQSPATVTGLTLTPLTQEVTGIGLDCAAVPCCVPTGIFYQRLEWPGLSLCDPFGRDESDGWGSAPTGQAYTTSGGAAADYSVSGGRAHISHPVMDLATRMITAAVNYTDVDVYTEISVPVLATGGKIGANLHARTTDIDNRYQLTVDHDTVGTLDVSLVSVVGGVSTTLATLFNFLPYTPGGVGKARLRIVGTTLRAKIWTGGDEPSGWDLTVTDANHTSGAAGVDSRLLVGNSNPLPVVVSFDNLAITPVELLDARFELQRFDPHTDWQTIMLADMCVLGFSDFEARVGVDSVYRIRIRNLLDFAGAWSTQVTGTVPTPGIDGSCDDMTGALIFTANADQSGGSNAAYIMQWDGTPTEDFTFAEADEVRFQAMYGRDGVVAFHGTERGLESFTRVLLIQAGAIDPIRLADVATLRDLAWADLPYVCVRDDIGDRWLANVRVPTANARQDRGRYLAGVEIVETTRTAAVVTP